MNRSLLDRLVSRRVSLALMIFIVAAALIGVVVPQRANSTPAQYAEWAAAQPTYAAFSSALQFDRVFSSWWFLVGLALFLISSSIATVRMLALSRRRYSHGLLKATSSIDGVGVDEAVRRARTLGYRPAPSAEGMLRLVRHRVGWWGPALMHLGIVVALASGIVSAAFDSHGVMDLSLGEIHSPGDPYLYEEPALIGGLPDLDYPLRLDSVDAELWPSGEVRFLEVTLSVLDEDGAWQPRSSSANSPLGIEGYSIYVSPGEFGDAAFVELEASDLPDSAVRFEFPMVATGTVGYSEFQPDGWPLVEGRLDPSGLREDGGGKSLALRVLEQGETHQVSLDEGESGEFGPYSATYAHAGQWARLSIVRPVAIEMIFLGFAIIGLGSVMIYTLIPRELVLEEAGSGLRYSWRAARTPAYFQDEIDRILDRSGVNT